MDEPLFRVTALALDPANPDVLYLGTGHEGIGKSVDGGASWFPINAGLTDGNIEALAIDPTNPGTVFAGTRFHGVFRTQDGGGLWTRFSDRLEQRGVSTLLVDEFGQPAVGLANGGLALHEGCRSAHSLCLSRERFRVEVDWRSFRGATGRGFVVPEPAGDSGLFWFFAPDNWEMLVKVLDGCAANGHFWVFAAATTNVEYTLRVTDTETGERREYRNPLGRAEGARWREAISSPSAL